MWIECLCIVLIVVLFALVALQNVFQIIQYNIHPCLLKLLFQFRYYAWMLLKEQI